MYSSRKKRPFHSHMSGLRMEAAGFFLEHRDAGKVVLTDSILVMLLLLGVNRPNVV